MAPAPAVTSATSAASVLESKCKKIKNILQNILFLILPPVAPVHSASTVRMGLQAVRKLVIVERINLLVGNVLTTVVERK